ncbi:hypothetical protein H5410_061191 [Solanum commersonii]|uniref:Uncharacterized protein n=1 Tax=Solanum commersonii TaxID=4109 RepID=A0A9J5W7F9_SOLCO|nr:hypothetical protein H5410_061191 [Solanum commersonii]
MESTSSSASPFQRTAQPHTIDTSTENVHTSTQTLELSCPSQDKMDEPGVHSPTNAKRSTVSE